MSRPGERLPDDSTSPPEQHSSGQGAPLVIVSEQGRHSQASRRIVRAQAARASAAQSRVTRARNRDQRQSGVRESPLSSSHGASPFASPPAIDLGPQITPIPGSGPHQYLPDQASAKPLTRWLVALLGLSVSPSGTIHPAFPSIPPPSRLDFGSLQLPLALPRGFIGLQQAIDVPPHMLTLLSRTACFDFASQGVDHRLNHLLHDLILDPRTSAGHDGSLLDHPVEGFLRIACICLTIYQGQHANGQVFRHDIRYQDGLRAAWAEARTLDPRPLADPKLAEVSLWIFFATSVTTGFDIDFFLDPVRDALGDLQLLYWEHVRRVLLDFIFPVSVLDEPFRQFYHRVTSLSQRPSGSTA